MNNKMIYAITCVLLLFGVLVASTSFYVKNRSGENPSSLGTHTSSGGNISSRNTVHSENSLNVSSSKGSPQETANHSESKSPYIAYLTFDDGPSGSTARLLDVLEDRHVKATFFVIGREDAQSDEILRRMVREGHVIGIHSWSHKYSDIYSSEERFLQDFHKISDHIFQVTDVHPNVSRFPGGMNNTVCLKYGGHIMPRLYQDVVSMGIKPFDWNVAAHDACRKAPQKEVILQNILTGCEKHFIAIILLHDTNSTVTTLQALPEIIDSLAAKGYRFETLSPSSPEVLFRPA